MIQAVQGYAAETKHGAIHQDRWNRVLDAFGVINHTSSMTAEQAQKFAKKLNPNRWNPIVEALTALEAAQQQSQQQQQQQQQSQQVNPNTCNWNDPNYVNPPSCYEAQQTQTPQQRLTELKQRADSANAIVISLKWANEELYNTVMHLIQTAIEDLDDAAISLAAGDPNSIAQAISFMNNVEPTLTHVIEPKVTELQTEAKRLATNTPYEPCTKPNTTCTYYDNGQIETYTHTADGFYVNQGTQWQDYSPGLTSILTFDDQGNYISKEYKYGENRDTYTTYHKDHTTGYYLSVVYTYAEYRSDGTKMYDIRYAHASNPDLDVRESYYWNDGTLKGKYEKSHGQITAKECRKSSGPTTTCDSPYYFNKYLHP